MSVATDSDLRPDDDTVDAVDEVDEIDEEGAYLRARCG